jgi:single-strand DNA-binding protein
MANFHKLIVIGRLVSDPKVRTFTNGGRVAKFGLPVDFTRRKKNPTTGQWEGDSFIIDVDVFNRESGAKLADLVEQYLKKGSQVYVEGRLKPNEYTDRNGQKVFKPVLVADNIQFLDPRQDGDPMSEESHRGSRGGPVSQASASAPPHDDSFDEPSPRMGVADDKGEDNIPF